MIDNAKTLLNARIYKVIKDKLKLHSVIDLVANLPTFFTKQRSYIKNKIKGAIIIKLV